MQTQQTTTDVLDIGHLLSALVALKKGDFSVRLPVEWTGVVGKVADTFNDVIELNEKLAQELIIDRAGDGVSAALVSHIHARRLANVTLLTEGDVLLDFGKDSFIGE